MDILSQQFEDKLWKEVENIVYRDKNDNTNLNTAWKSEDEKKRFTFNLISHLLTSYGMDKNTQEAILLSDLDVSMQQFDCCRGFGNRTYLIDKAEAVNKVDLYKDDENYLVPTLEAFNQPDEIVIVPTDAFSPDHGLFHSLSVALVGKEIFWHPLQAHFYRELKNNTEKYQTCDQLSHSNLENLLKECNPDEVTGNKIDHQIQEMLFIMANVLKRTIIVLGNDAKRDDAGIFLPLLCEPGTCHKSGICLAWKNKEKNKLIAIAGVKGNSKLPFHLLPKPWECNDQQSVRSYLPVDSSGKISIKGKQFSEKYLTDLIDCMRNHHKQLYGIGINLVAEVYRCIFQATNFTHVPTTAVLSVVKTAIDDVRIYKCLDCRYTGVVPRFLVKDGKLHNQALAQHGKELNYDKKYCFPYLGIQGKADRSTDNIISSKSICRLLSCPMCHKKRMRKVDDNGDAVYFNGDVMPSGKYYWNGQEYDSKPKVIPIGLEWRGDVIPSNIEWFHGESDGNRNSTFEGVVDILVQKHYPDNPEPRLRERVKHIVRMRLEQQQDLDIPGIEKRKPQTLPPPPMKPVDNPPEMKIASSNEKNSRPSVEEVPADIDDESDDDDDEDDDLYGGNPTVATSPKVATPRSMNSSQNSNGAPVIPYGSGHESPEDSSGSDNDDLYGQKSTPKTSTPKTKPVDSSPGYILPPKSNRPASPPTVPKTVPSALDSPVAAMAVSSVSGSSSVHSSKGSVPSPGKSKRVVVISANGTKRTQVTLPPNVTFKQLQDMLADKTGIPNNKQAVKCGFPPKNIKPQSTQMFNTPLESIVEGDRIIVERVP